MPVITKHHTVSSDTGNQDTSQNVGCKAGETPILGDYFAMQCHQQHATVMQMQESTCTNYSEGQKVCHAIT